MVRSLFAGYMETLYPGNHGKVTEYFDENLHVMNWHILTGKLKKDIYVYTLIDWFLWQIHFLVTEIPFCHSKEFPVHKRTSCDRTKSCYNWKISFKFPVTMVSTKHVHSFLSVWFVCSFLCMSTIQGFGRHPLFHSFKGFQFC